MVLISPIITKIKPRKTGTDVLVEKVAEEKEITPEEARREIAARPTRYFPSSPPPSPPPTPEPTPEPEPTPTLTPEPTPTGPTGGVLSVTQIEHQLKLPPTEPERAYQLWLRHTQTQLEELLASYEAGEIGRRDVERFYREVYEPAYRGYRAAAEEAWEEEWRKYEADLRAAGFTPGEIGIIKSSIKAGDIERAEQYIEQIWPAVWTRRQRELYPEAPWESYYRATGDPLGGGIFKGLYNIGKFLVHDVPGFFGVETLPPKTYAPSTLRLTPGSQLLWTTGEILVTLPPTFAGGYVAGLGLRAVGPLVVRAARPVVGAAKVTTALHMTPEEVAAWTRLGSKASALALEHPAAVKALAYGVPYGIYGGLEAGKVKQMAEMGLPSERIAAEVGRDIAIVGAFGYGFVGGMKTDVPARVRTWLKRKEFRPPEKVFPAREGVPTAEYRSVDELIAKFKSGKYGLEPLLDQETLILNSAIRNEMRLLTKSFRLTAKHPPPIEYYPESAALMGRYRIPSWIVGGREFSFKQWWMRKLFAEKIQVWKQPLDQIPITVRHEFKHWADIATKGWSTERSAVTFERLLTPQDFARFSKSLERYWGYHAAPKPFEPITAVRPGFRAEKGLFLSLTPEPHFFRIPSVRGPYTRVLGWGPPTHPALIYTGVTDILPAWAPPKPGAAYVTWKATRGIHAGMAVESEVRVREIGAALERISSREYTKWQGRIVDIDRYLIWGGEEAKAAIRRGAEPVWRFEAERTAAMDAYYRELGSAVVDVGSLSYAAAGIAISYRPPAPTYYQPPAPPYKPFEYKPPHPPEYKPPEYKPYKPPEYKPYKLPEYKPPTPPEYKPYKPPEYRPPYPPYPPKEPPPPTEWTPMRPGFEPEKLFMPKFPRAKVKPFERIWPVGEIEKLFERPKPKARARRAPRPKAREFGGLLDARQLQKSLRPPKMRGGRKR